MAYRTRTYIAADWTGDRDAIDQLRKWNESNYWSLSFTDAHDLTQARDKSLNCSIKKSLAQRLDISKTLVLIVGTNTRNVRFGSCQYCNSDNSDCGSYSNKSYINYECEKAKRDGLKIIILYNAATVDKNKCPDALKNIGKHVAMCYYQNGTYYWDYNAVKNAFA